MGGVSLHDAGEERTKSIKKTSLEEEWADLFGSSRVQQKK